VHSIGIDIGGTAIKAGLLDDIGALVKTARRESVPANPDAIVEHTISLVRELAEGLDGGYSVGVAVAAFLNAARDTVVLSPNIAWENRSLRAELESSVGVPITLENDANAAAWGEYQQGAGVDAESMVMFTLGTGVGGAVILGNKLLVGARGIAGELGHIIVEPDGPQCGCGQYGCLEAVASATAFVREYRAHTGDHEVTTATIEKALSDQPELSADLYRRAARALALALVDVQAVFDPDCVVFGGGMADKAGPVLVPLVEQHWAELTRNRRSHARPSIRLATLGNNAGVIGAALASRAPGVRAD
jgi:glucokinase